MQPSYMLPAKTLLISRLKQKENYILQKCKHTPARVVLHSDQVRKLLNQNVLTR